MNIGLRWSRTGIQVGRRMRGPSRHTEDNGWLLRMTGRAATGYGSHGQ
jgi:hypothetical protein